MKKYSLLVLACIALLASCSKDENEAAPAQNNCPVNIALLKDVDWFNASFAGLRFQADGGYYEGNNQEGTWAVSNGCDSIYIVRPSSNFYYRVMSLSADTLHLRNPVFGDITYVR